MKQFKEFEAMVPGDFSRQMILYWREDENSTKDDVLAAYYDDDFKQLDRRIAGTRCTFRPDLGYRDKNIDGTLCFEVDDNNVVIPVSILEVV